MTTRPWRPFGVRSNVKRWRKARAGPRIGSEESCLGLSNQITTGAGSTALWGTDHLWTLNKTRTKNERSRLKYCDHKKGGREPFLIPQSLWIICAGSKEPSQSQQADLPACR